MYELSVLIPARNEEFLSLTVKNILKNIRGNTEIIVVLDGEWASPGVPDDKRVTIIYNHKSVGQRAAQNQAARVSRAKYLMKLDAHCVVDEGFDVKMISKMKDDYTMVPRMYNLYGFDWVCTSCPHRHYQGPTPTGCPKCGKPMKRDIKFAPRLNRRSLTYRFDHTLHFQYWGSLQKRLQPVDGLMESMSLQGSSFMCTREKYWELNLCDEKFGSWGQQGTEVALKTWLSGGKVVANDTTWYSHLFRTQGGDFGFPYPISGNQQEHAREYCRDLFFNNKYEKQIYPLSWLIDKFWPIPDWDKPENSVVLDMVRKKGKEFNEKKPTKGLIFYTDNQLPLKIAHSVQNQLRRMNLPIVSASLKPMTFGKNIHLPLVRGYLTMFKQILSALEASDADIIFFTEHDVIYHPSHFDFTPLDKKTWYYNINWWKVDLNGRAVHWDADQVSGICVYRDTAVEYYRRRIELFNAGKFDRKFEPQSGEGSKSWWSKYPDIDIRHGKNLTYSKWSLDDFRNKDTAKNFKLSTVDKIPGWNFSRGVLKCVALK